ncbi:MAG: biotin--[acetyl-CoA-carboxylase] ligase [Actinomycetota bacterium]|nr:biotin--[acetyl-CoA-carboxylase] ligase [Actinomycetota bacterium]
MNRLSPETIRSMHSPLARAVEVHEALVSTQERARELAKAGTPHGTLVVAEVQIGGRGRLGRSWGSPKGGLWMSLVLRPRFDASLAPRITQTAAVGVAKALWEIGVEARIKWPNDLLAGGKKICGILAESSPEDATVPPNGRRLDYVILGVGMNANLDPAELGVPGRRATTIRSEVGQDVDLFELLRALLSNLDAELGRIEDFGSVLEDWRNLNCTLGEKVSVRRFGETLEGRAVDLTAEGALLLATYRGTIELFEGEIEHLRQKGKV